MVAGGDLGLRRGTDSALCRFTCIEDLESSLSTTYAAARASPLPGVIALIHIAAHHHWAVTITSACCIPRTSGAWSRPANREKAVVRAA